MKEISNELKNALADFPKNINYEAQQHIDSFIQDCIDEFRVFTPKQTRTKALEKKSNANMKEKSLKHSLEIQSSFDSLDRFKQLETLAHKLDYTAKHVVPKSAKPNRIKHKIKPEQRPTSQAAFSKKKADISLEEYGLDGDRWGDIKDPRKTKLSSASAVYLAKDSSLAKLDQNVEVEKLGQEYK